MHQGPGDSVERSYKTATPYRRAMEAGAPEEPFPSIAQWARKSQHAAPTASLSVSALARSIPDAVHAAASLKRGAGSSNRRAAVLTFVASPLAYVLLRYLR